jgi:hypothetical protein
MWSEQERTADLRWITANLGTFWQVAQRGFATHGRGAIGVDTTVRAPGGGHPFGYLTQAQIQHYGGHDEVRMVATYHSAQEMVIVLLKPLGRISSYRIGTPPQDSNRTIRE